MIKPTTTAHTSTHASRVSHLSHEDPMAFIDRMVIHPVGHVGRSPHHRAASAPHAASSKSTSMSTGLAVTTPNFGSATGVAAQVQQPPRPSILSFFVIVLLCLLLPTLVVFCSRRVRTWWRLRKQVRSIRRTVRTAYELRRNQSTPIRSGRPRRDTVTCSTMRIHGES